MNNELELVAAVLAPRDLAPHPNFRSSERVSLASLLALLSSARLSEYSAMRDREEFQELAESNPADVELLDEVLASFDIETLERGATGLMTKAVDAELSSGRRTACALLSAVFLAELDRTEESIDMLKSVRASIRAVPEADYDFFSGSLSQNLALREWDTGLDGTASASEARTAMERFDADSVPVFELSAGVAWASPDTLKSIRDLVKDASAQHLAHADDDISASLQLVRQGSSVPLMRLRGRIATALGKYLESTYQSLTQPNRITWRSDSGVGYEELTEALMQAELAGHPITHHLRGLLGSLLYVRGRALNQEAQLEEALRLFRHSQQKKLLSPALSSVRASGPLAPLRDQGLRVIARPRDPTLWSQVDFLTVEMSANLLDRTNASRAIDLCIAASNAPAAARWARREARHFRLEYIWKCALRLAPSADRESEVAGLFLECAALNQDMDYTWARLVRRIGESVWSNVDFFRQVQLLLETSLNARDFPELSRAVRETGRMVGALEGDRHWPDELDIQTIAELVDLEIIREERIPPELEDRVVEVLSQAMETTRASARQGHFSMGGVSECDIAVAFALKRPTSAIWTEITAFVLDPLVRREDKSRALERLTTGSESIPPPVAEIFRKEPAALLKATPNLFGSDIEPYPEAVRLLAALGLIPRADIVLLCGQLLSSGDPAARAQGAQVIRTIAIKAPDTDWIFPFAVGASFDPNYDSRAEAALTLALMRRSNSDVLSAIDQRLISLLDEDGLNIPLMALDGLSETVRTLDRPLEARIRALAATHIHRIVRARAQEIVDQMSGREE